MCPHVLQFDSSDKTHLDFIVAASNLIAYVYDIPKIVDRHEIIQQLNQNPMVKFQVKTTVTNDDDDLKSNTCGGFESETVSKIDTILSQLPKVDELLNLKVQPHDLKLEDDFNFQLDYIVAATNLRAENYGIETVERIEVKRIAGRIIPAIVTTTTVVAGLMSLEMYKISEVYERLTNKKVADHVRSLILEIGCDDLQGNEIEDVPYVNYIFR
ncbi:unnamed protein product [Rotaria sp. Silwood1]|nr:unnamed protein product [Rotaria sp. Silwood1]